MLETLCGASPDDRGGRAGRPDGRLEDLLNELSHGDQRIRSLEEMLRASQEANQAEQEERQQIEKWLNDIESRLTERQSEWLAEREVLLGRLEKQREQRDELYQQLEQATAAVPAPEVPRGALQKLQSQIDELQEQLQASRRTAEPRPKSRRKALETQLSEGSYHEQVEAAVREERLKLAQERAALSRERAELARRSGTTICFRTRKPTARSRCAISSISSKPCVNSINKSRHQTYAETGLGSRLAELWRRLDGPTDTD